jgi:hypothetical protein
MSRSIVSFSDASLSGMYFSTHTELCGMHVYHKAEGSEACIVFDARSLTWRVLYSHNLSREAARAVSSRRALILDLTRRRIEAQDSNLEPLGPFGAPVQKIKQRARRCCIYNVTRKSLPNTSCGSLCTGPRIINVRCFLHFTLEMQKRLFQSVEGSQSSSKPRFLQCDACHLSKIQVAHFSPPFPPTKR